MRKQPNDHCASRIMSTNSKVEMRHYVAVVEDAIASNTPALHDAALLVMRSQFRVRTSATLTRAWEPAAVRG